MLSRNKCTVVTHLSLLLLLVCGAAANAALVYRTNAEAHYDASGPSGWEISDVDSISYDNHGREVERIKHVVDTRTPLSFKLSTRQAYTYQGDYPSYYEWITSNWDSPIWDTTTGDRVERTFDGNGHLVSEKHYTLELGPSGTDFVWAPKYEVQYVLRANGIPDSIKTIGYKESTGRFETPRALITFAYGGGGRDWTVMKSFAYVTDGGRDEYVGTTKMVRNFEGGLLVSDSLLNWDDTLRPNPDYVKVSINLYTYTDSKLTKHEYKVWNGSFYANTLLWEYQWDGDNQTLETHSFFDPSAGTDGAYKGVYQRQMLYNANDFMATRYTKRFDGDITEDSLEETWSYDSHDNLTEYALKQWDEGLSTPAYANVSKTTYAWTQVQTSVRQVAAVAPKASLSIATSAGNRLVTLKGDISQATVALYNLAGRRVTAFSVSQGAKTAQFAIDRKISNGRYILKVTAGNAMNLATLPLLIM